MILHCQGVSNCPCCSSVLKCSAWWVGGSISWVYGSLCKHALWEHSAGKSRFSLLLYSDTVLSLMTAESTELLCQAALTLILYLYFPGGIMAAERVVSSYFAHSEVCLTCYESNGFTGHFSNILRACEHLFSSGKSCTETW